MIYHFLFCEVKLIRENNKHNSLSMKPNIFWILAWAAIAILVCSFSRDRWAVPKGAWQTALAVFLFMLEGISPLAFIVIVLLWHDKKSIAFPMLVPVHCGQLVASLLSTSVVVVFFNTHPKVLVTLTV